MGVEIVHELSFPSEAEARAALLEALQRPYAGQVRAAGGGEQSRWFAYFMRVIDAGQWAEEREAEAHFRTLAERHGGEYVRLAEW